MTFEQYHGKKNIGSSRIRCDWPIKHWKSGGGIGDAERYHLGQHYDVMIYQKAYWIEHAKAFQGVKILDLCDPDWLTWSYPIKEMIDLCDAVTCSTFEIAKFISQLADDKPVWVIPDRIDFTNLPKPKTHFGPLKRCVWYGYSENFEVLGSAIPALKKRGLELIVVSNESYVDDKRDIEIRNLPWTPTTWMDDIMKGDVVLNPQPKVGRFKYKSDNKTVQAYALGLPVAHTDKELDQFLTAEARNKEAVERYESVRTDRDVIKSVKEISELITELYASKGIPLPH